MYMPQGFCNCHIFEEKDHKSCIKLFWTQPVSCQVNLRNLIGQENCFLPSAKYVVRQFLTHFTKSDSKLLNKFLCIILERNALVIEDQTVIVYRQKMEKLLNNILYSKSHHIDNKYLIYSLLKAHVHSHYVGSNICCDDTTCQVYCNDNRFTM